VVSRDRPFPKRTKKYLRVGCSSTTTSADSQDFPKIQGCSLHKIERKIRWSVGTDRLKNRKKLTFEFVPAEIQLHQIPKLSKGFGDAPYERDQKVVKKKLALTTPKKKKKLT
jgi:hypothetical protein